MNSQELIIITTEPNFTPCENTVSKIRPKNEITEKLNPGYTKIVWNNANDTNDATVVIITLNNNNRFFITESKSGEHDKTNEESICKKENQI